MKHAQITLLLCAVLSVAASAAILIIGCSSPADVSFRPASDSSARSSVPAMCIMKESSAQFAHGGTTTVNGAAYDAMFFKNYGINPFVDSDEDNLSTFAIDVDTGSYTICRRYLQDGNVPPEAAVRVEEFVNYFNYNYAPPKGEDEDFAVHLAAAPSRFGSGKTLLRVGLKGREVTAEDRKPAVLTFVIDVSGSMATENRLGAVKDSLRMLVGQLRDSDRVGIAVFGSQGRKYLDHRGLEHREEILKAIDQLSPEGSTNADEGLRVGYAMAEKAFDREAINRVILCSDGVANVGDTAADAILKNIRKHVDRGIFLTTVGFGMGNFNDELMERFADTGNGAYAYVDSKAEARRLFVEQLTGTLQTIARDVKVQVEFDPQVVRSYRLLGYENRDVADNDFRNDKVDGGEVGAGHSVTALYELKLEKDAPAAGTLATVRVRWKKAEVDDVREIEQKIAADNVAEDFDSAPVDLRLAACVAESAEILRRSYWARGSSMADVADLARSCSAAFDKRADIEEFAALTRTAAKLVKSDNQPTDEAANPPADEPDAVARAQE